MNKRNLLTLGDEFLEYCRLNDIKDVEKLAKETFQRGFTILKYGETPYGIKGSEKIVEKEVIKEVIVERVVEKEIPIEKIVEVIKEVPVEIKGETQIITKEVIKEVTVTDNVEIDRLKEENKRLSEENNKLNDALNKFNKATFMKNSDLNTLYGE
jgi:hypothetical protein